MVKEELGLRELKKQLTRESIADAALQLTLEKGLGDVTIEEIAQVAFVSPRTVSNYFSCKEEAIVSAGGSASAALLDEFALRPAEEAPLDSLREVIAASVSSSTPEQLRLSVQKMRLVDENPSLRPYQVAQHAHLEEVLRTQIAERNGCDVEKDLYPWLVAGAAVTAVTAAMRLWAHQDAPPERLVSLVEDAFTLTSRGLRLPSHEHTSVRVDDVHAEESEPDSTPRAG
jgi:AcrR family transcriptional regulator